MSMRALAFLAGAGNAYADVQDKKKQQERLDAEERRRQQEFEAQQAERQRLVADRQTLRDAAAPVPVTEQEMAGPVDPGNANPAAAAPMPTAYKVGAAQFASRGLADQAAEQQRTTRLTAALDQVDPAGAVGRKAQSAQLALSEAQLRRYTEEAVKEGEMQALTVALNGGTPDQVAAVYNRTGTKKVTDIKVTPFEYQHPTLGKIQSARIEGKTDDGKPFAIENAAEASMNLLGLAKRFDIELQGRRDKATADHQAGMLDVARQNANSLEQQRRDAAAHQARMEGYSRAALAASRAAQPANAPPLWTPEADKTLLAHYSSKDAESGAPAMDGNGLMFAKTVALAASQRFQGDTTKAIAFAVDQDNALKARAAEAAKASGGKITPEAALRTEREAALQRLFGPQQPAPTNVSGIATAPPGSVVRQGNQWVPAGTPAAQAAQGVSPAGAAPASADPMAAIAAKESSELNKGTRLDFSPGVKAYFAAKKKMEAEAQAAALDAERQAAVAKSKAQLGR